MKFSKNFEHNESLFNAAIEAFSTAGYEQASINTILKNAGMSKGQFYYHFKNKQGLYFALIEILIDSKRAFLAGVMREEDYQQDIFTLLKTQIKYGIAFSKAYPEVDRLSNSFLKEKGNAIYDRVLERFNFEEDKALNRLISHAYQNGDFRSDLPLAFIQKTIGYLFTHAADLTGLSQTDRAEEALEQLISFMKSGLAPAAGVEEKK